MKQKMLVVLYYVSIVLLYHAVGLWSMLRLFAFELFGPLADVSWYKVLTSPVVPWSTKLDQVVYLFLHIPFGLSVLFAKTEDGWLYLLAVSGDALLLSWLLRRWMPLGRRWVR